MPADTRKRVRSLQRAGRVWARWSLVWPASVVCMHCSKHEAPSSEPSMAAHSEPAAILGGHLMHT
jgi:hypothetical protein